MRTARSSSPAEPSWRPPPQDATLAQTWDVRVPGTYLLLIRLDAAVQIDVGRLGRLAFPPGWYVYVGSALGGLGARLRRHARQEKRPHWHVDALRAVGVLTAIAIHPGAERLECVTATTIAGWPGATQPVPRFGSSDCRCRSHLVYTSGEPDLHVDPDWLVFPFTELPFTAR